MNAKIVTMYIINKIIKKNSLFIFKVVGCTTRFLATTDQ